MTVQRARGETYLLYNNHIKSSEKYGGVERIDPVSLETICRSPRLPSGGHTWCGGVLVHENGYLYANNGDRCFKLDPDCNVVVEAKLPQDSAYNSLLSTADGRLVMKNIEHASAGVSKFVVLDPERLEQVGPEVAIPENSMGRIAMDTKAAGQQIYVPGSHHFYRYAYHDGELTLDPDWQPLYRRFASEVQSFSWDSCLADGGCWFLDNGDNEANVTIFGTRPFGLDPPPRGSAFRGRASSPQKLWRIDLDDPDRVSMLEPFKLPRGSIFSPPAFDPIRQIAIAFDTGNGRLGAFRYEPDGRFIKLWARSCRISMQLVLFLDSGELAVNDFERGFDELVILDVESGREKARVATESRTANGMFLSTGWARDVLYCSIGSIARVHLD
jgi:hypothetical protein